VSLEWKWAARPPLEAAEAEEGWRRRKKKKAEKECIMIRFGLCFRASLEWYVYDPTTSSFLGLSTTLWEVVKGEIDERNTGRYFIDKPCSLQL
jgi:hypothetical protein